MRTKFFTVLQKKSLYPKDSLISLHRSKDIHNKKQGQCMIDCEMIRTVIDLSFDDTEVRGFTYKSGKDKQYGEIIAIPSIRLVIRLFITESKFDITLWNPKYTQMIFSDIRDSYGDLYYNGFMEEFIDIVSWIDQLGYPDIEVDEQVVNKLRTELPVIRRMVYNEINGTQPK